MDREKAIAAAMKLVDDEPPGRPVIGLGDVFTVDEGQSWVVHFVPEPVGLGGYIALDTPGVYIAVVSGKTGRAQMGGDAIAGP
jgi:hypothetical protein